MAHLATPSAVKLAAASASAAATAPGAVAVADVLVAAVVAMQKGTRDPDHDRTVSIHVIKNVRSKRQVTMCQSQ